MDRSSASNTITGAIDGITLTLSKAEPGTVRELRVDVDTSSQKSAVKALVSSFNAATQMVVTTSSYNTSTKTAAPLNGDAMARGIGADLRAVASANVADLKAVGITIAKDGTLKLDEAAFDASIAKDPAIAARLFTGASSTFAAALKGSVDGLLDGEGPLASRSEGLERRSKSLAKDRADLDMRMTLAESRYRTQFTALDSLMTKLNSSMSFLQQQLGL
jgi:flagellar hook-associated protein 2